MVSCLALKWFHRFLLFKLGVYTIHYPHVDFSFISCCIIAISIYYLQVSVMTCIPYHPFYHLPSVHVCKTIGTHQNNMLNYEQLQYKEQAIQAIVVCVSYFTRQIFLDIICQPQQILTTPTYVTIDHCLMANYMRLSLLLQTAQFQSELMSHNFIIFSSYFCHNYSHSL